MQRNTRFDTLVRYGKTFTRDPLIGYLRPAPCAGVGFDIAALPAKQRSSGLALVMYSFLVFWATNFLLFQTNGEIANLQYSVPLFFMIAYISVAMSLYVLWKFLSKRIVSADVLANKYLIGLYALAPLSIFYAPIMRQTFDVYTQMLSLTLVTAACAALAPTPQKCLDDFYRFFIVVVLLCYVAVALRPAAGIHVDDFYNKDVEAVIGGWRGIFWHKNTAGVVCALGGVLAAIFRPSGWLGRPLVRFGVFALSILFVYLSKDKTALSLCFVAIGLFWVFRIFARPIASARSAIAFGFTVFLFTFYYVGLTVLDPLFGMKFSNRSYIWQLHHDYWLQSPLFGHGYAGVVSSRGGIAAFGSGWQALMPHAHNGYLDVIGQLGIVGAALLFGAIFVSLKSGLARIADPRQAIWARPAITLLFICLITSLMEQTTFSLRFVWTFSVVMMLLLNGASPFTRATRTVGRQIRWSATGARAQTRA